LSRTFGLLITSFNKIKNTISSTKDNTLNQYKEVIILQEIINRIRAFRNAREWGQFHTPENLAKSIAIEAGELLENFQWNNEYDETQVTEELADVMIYCMHMADALGVDMREIITDKMDKNELKYPVEKAKGNSKKYTQL
jgi:NTP pyrophosphatase (non-canonical NTP hydrolase)